MKGSLSFNKACLFGAFAVTFVSFLTSVVFYDSPSDASIFRYVGWRIAEGGNPFLEAWDHKGPIIFYLNALGFALFQHTIGVAFVYLCLWWGTLILGYKTLSVYISPRASAVAMLLFSLLASWGVLGGTFQNNVGIVAVFITLLTLYLQTFTKGLWRAFWVGLGVGALVFVKPNMLAIGPTIVFSFWLRDAFREGRWMPFVSACLLSFVGFVLTLAGVSLLFFWQGNLALMWDETLVFNLLEYHQDVTLGDYWWDFLFVRYKETACKLAGSIALFPLTFMGIRYLWKQRKGRLLKDFPEQQYPTGQVLLFLGVWAFFEVLIAFACKVYYDHYIINAYVPLCAFAGVFIASLRYEKTRFKTLIAVGACFLCCLLAVYRLTWKNALAWRTNEDRHALYTWLNEKTEGKKTIAVWGMQATAEVLTKCQLRTQQQYFCQLGHHPYANATRQKQMEDEFLRALQNEAITLFLTEGQRPRLEVIFAHRPDILAELDTWDCVYHSTANGTLTIYEKYRF